MSIGCTGAMAIKEPGSDDESRRSEDDGDADEDFGNSDDEDEEPSDEDDDQQSLAGAATDVTAHQQDDDVDERGESSAADASALFSLGTPFTLVGAFGAAVPAQGPWHKEQLVQGPTLGPSATAWAPPRSCRRTTWSCGRR